MNSVLPQHIAIIMDGNGRWAQKRGLPRNFGHRQGVKTAKRIITACIEIGIKYLTFYTFSTENWKRPKQEVDTLMELLENYIDRRKKEIPYYGRIKVTVIGRWWELPRDLPLKIKNLIAETKDNKQFNLILAINYGGRREILDAIQSIVNRGKEDFTFDEASFKSYLYAPEIPDPDLLIRTAGEFRISNFLIWQISYTELYVTKKLWPDFKRADLIKAIKEYQRRQRKFGGL